MFTSYPIYSPYRTLALTTPAQRGEDVYALQKAINAIALSGLIPDGELGPHTASALLKAQRKVGVADDGKAGVITQRAFALRILKKKLVDVDLVPRLTEGQLQHESSFLLGNYSPERGPMNFDAGVAQLNSTHHRLRDAFDPVHAIGLLVDTTRGAYARYSAKAKFRGSDHSERRRWALAAGAWNAPAYANWLAGVQPWAEPGPSALQTFEAYMRDVTIYLNSN